MRALTISLLGLLVIAATGISFCDGNSNVLCIESERQALLKFKQDLIDPSNRLSSWVEGGDCCKWIGVFCHNLTGHINELHLAPLSNFPGYGALPAEIEAYYRSQLGGKINPSLLDLKHLSFLDLSSNNFSSIPIPKFIGSLRSLTYLNLSCGQFRGAIPEELGNLSRLHYLDLRAQGYNWVNIEAKNLQWVSGLSSLQYLDLSSVNLINATNWLQVINKLPFLLELHLSYCHLEDDPSVIRFNSTNLLAVIDLSWNRLFSVPTWVFSLNGLVSINLSGNMLEGRVSTFLEHLCNLKEIDLSYNKIDQELLEILQSLSICGLDRLESLNLANNRLSGPIPFWIRELTSLKLFDVSKNNLNGTFPQSFGQLANLETLSFGYNLLEGVVSDMHFSNLKRLRTLAASENLLIFKPNPNWIPPFQCQTIELSHWHLGPKFPQWLTFEKNLVSLDISYTRISDVIPTWFWNLSSQFQYVNLSHNQLNGGILYFPKGSMVDLSWNQFTGPLPRALPTLEFLFLSKNLFSGPLSQFVCNSSSENLRILQIDRNLLSGEIPDCWKPWINLVVLNLENNYLTGKIPHSLGNTSLSVLNLRKNSLFGQLPSTLQNCTPLEILDLSENHFSGSIPAWIGDKLSSLMVLKLRSNNFHGHIPHEICALNFLQNLDLAHNNISGVIPKCFSNLSAMANQKRGMYTVIPMNPSFDLMFYFDAFLVIKGREDEYSTTLGLIVIIDLSANSLTGEISEELGNLTMIRSLNLSRNLLTGKIPEMIGNMKSLESLDLSMNRFYGEIPSSFSNLNFLSQLNLSYNNLTGQIPSGTQLQSFDNFSYIGNHLCGPPITKSCSIGKTPDVTKGGSSEGKNKSKVNWFYVSIVLGFVMGFWGVVAPLYFIKSWRFAYYKKLEHIGDKLYVFWATVGM